MQGDPQCRVLVPTCSELTSLVGRVPARQDPGGKAVSTAWTLEGSCPPHLAPSRGRSSFTFSVFILLCGLFLYFRRLQPGSGAVLAALFGLLFLSLFISFGIRSSFPGGSDGKEPAYYAGDLGSVLGLGRLPGEGNGYPLQYSGLENSRDREAWEATYNP